jgi:hypothetical protein
MWDLGHGKGLTKGRRWKTRMRGQWAHRHRRLCRRRSGCRHGRLVSDGQPHKDIEKEGQELTIKLVAASQPCTLSSLEDTLAVAQSTDVRASRITEAIRVREGHDPATIAGTDTRDTQWQEALEGVRTGGTCAVERQRDRRALLIGTDRTVSLLAGEFGLGCERNVQAGDEVCRGRWVGALRGKTRREGLQSIIGAEVSANLCQTGLLGCVSVCGYEGVSCSKKD